jgi:hypothetical protein
MITNIFILQTFNSNGRKDHSPYHEAGGYQGQVAEVPRY